jgi:hypothetical protein
MSYIPPPWVIEEIESERRRREVRDRPRIDAPPPPQPAGPATEGPDTPVEIVIDASAS